MKPSKLLLIKMYGIPNLFTVIIILSNYTKSSNIIITLLYERALECTKKLINILIMK